VLLPPSEDRTAVGLNMAQAAKEAGVRFAVLLSVLGVERAPNTTFAKQFAAIEDTLKKTGLSYSILRFPLFMDYQCNNYTTVKNQAAFYYPVKPDSRFSHIAASDVGLALAAVAANAGEHLNTVYSVHGDETSANELATIYSRLTGRRIVFQQNKEDEAIKMLLGAGLPDWQAKAIVELWRLADAGQYAINNDGGNFEKLTGRKPLSTEQFLNSVSYNFRSSLTVAVTGAAGKSGKNTITELMRLSTSNNKILIRAQVRDKKKASEELFKEQKELELIEADALQNGQLTAFFRGADIAVLIPPAIDRVAVGLAQARAAKEAGVKFVVMLSVLAIDRDPNALFSKQFAEIEEAVRKTGIPYSLHRFPFFMDNQLANADSIKRESAFYHPVKPNSKFVHIASSDVGYLLATAATQPMKFAHTTWEIMGDETSPLELANIYSKLTNKKVTFVQQKETDAIKSMIAQGMPEWQAKGVLELWHIADAGKYKLAPGAQELYEKLTNRKNITTEQFLTRAAASFKA
jgi:NAD(P)H dehydrogenase (quinone)